MVPKHALTAIHYAEAFRPNRYAKDVEDICWIRCRRPSSKIEKSSCFSSYGAPISIFDRRRHDDKIDIRPEGIPLAEQWREANRRYGGNQQQRLRQILSGYDMDNGKRACRCRQASRSNLFSLGRFSCDGASLTLQSIQHVPRQSWNPLQILPTLERAILVAIVDDLLGMISTHAKNSR